MTTTKMEMHKLDQRKIEGKHVLKDQTTNTVTKIDWKCNNNTNKVKMVTAYVSTKKVNVKCLNQNWKINIDYENRSTLKNV